jgi:hypothetical protein
LTSIANPTAPNNSKTEDASARVAAVPKAKAEALAPTNAGVFGITRITLIPGGIAASIFARGTPAAIEITKCRTGSKTNFNSFNKETTWCGFTAKNKISAFATTSEFE